MFLCTFQIYCINFLLFGAETLVKCFSFLFKENKMFSSILEHDINFCKTTFHLLPKKDVLRTTTNIHHRSALFRKREQFLNFPTNLFKCMKMDSPKKLKPRGKDSPFCHNVQQLFLVISYSFSLALVVVFCHPITKNQSKQFSLNQLSIRHVPILDGID